MPLRARFSRPLVARSDVQIIRPSRRRRRAKPTAALLAAALVVLAACSSGGSSGLATGGGGSTGSDAGSSGGGSGAGSTLGATQSTEPGVATTLPQLAKGKLKVRFFNNITVGGKAGPAVDLYDDLEPSQAATSLPKGEKPIVANLAYGSFSDYLVPQMMTAQGSQGQTDFAALPAGTKPSAKNPIVGAGGLSIDNSPSQGTIILSGTAADSNDANATSGPLTPVGSSLNTGETAEKKGGHQGEPPSTAPSGKAVFLVDTDILPAAFNNSGTYFFIDGSCAPSSNGDDRGNLPSTFVSGAASSKLGPFPYFPGEPGSHQVALTSSDTGLVPTCDQIKPKSGDETTVSVKSDDSFLVLPYGIDKAHLKIATGVIAPSS